MGRLAGLLLSACCAAEESCAIPLPHPMLPLSGPGIETGISAVQLIYTSAIVIHTNDQSREMYLDVFSCKGFSEDDVIAYLNETFAPAAVNFQILYRN